MSKRLRITIGGVIPNDPTDAELQEMVQETRDDFAADPDIRYAKIEIDDVVMFEGNKDG